MPRAQNSHAYVNAGFLLKFQRKKVANARICFGGINPKLIHASATEQVLKGRDLYDNGTLQEALKALNEEIHPDWVLPASSPKYRKDLAISLFYRFILATSPISKISDQNRSGGIGLFRAISSGTATFEANNKLWPVNKPVEKIEGVTQCSGEAKYANDIPPFRDELWAAFVSATKVRTKIGKIDATEALVCSHNYNNNKLYYNILLILIYR